MKKITLLIAMFAWSSAFFAQTYLSEGFEDGFLPDGWADPAGVNNAGTAGTYTWAATTTRANSGTKSAWFNDFFPGETGNGVNKHRWLITKVMDLSGATTPELTYYESLEFAATPAVNNVYYSTDYNGSNLNTATWISLSTVTGGASWAVKGAYTLPVHATVYVAFEYEGDAKSQWFIDDVLVREQPTCVEPVSGSLTGVTTTGATFNWSSGPGGTEAKWDVDLVDITGGGTFSGTTPTASGVTNNTYTFSTLTADNTYHAYVRADCAANGTSTWVGPHVFTTAPTNDDCSGAQVIVQEIETLNAAAATATNGTIDNSTATLAAECGPNATAEEDVWYSFVAKTANVNIRFDLNFDGVAVLYSNACGDTPVVVICIDANVGTTSSFEEINASSLTVGDTYYVRVFNYYAKDHNNYVSNGNFTVKIWSPDSPPLAVENVELNQFKFYPNPVTTKLNLKAQRTIENVSIYNMLGQEVLRLAPNKSTSEIDMSSLRTGAYFVRVTINGTTETKQIIKR